MLITQAVELGAESVWGPSFLKPQPTSAFSETVAAPSCLDPAPHPTSAGQELHWTEEARVPAFTPSSKRPPRSLPSHSQMEGLLM